MAQLTSTGGDGEYYAFDLIKKKKKPAKKKKRPKKGHPVKFFFEGRLDVTYDDNVINYSDADLELFKSGRKPSKFAIEKKDDIIFAPATEFGLTTRRLTGRSTTLSAYIRFKVYGANDIKDYEYYRLKLEQDIIRKLSAYIQTAYIPDYYYRNQWDTDVDRYYEADFSKFFLYTGLDFDIFPHLRLSGDYKYDYKDFNERFDNLDAGTHSFEILAVERFNYYLKSWFEFRAGYKRAEGRNDPDPEKKDVSYDQKGFTAGCRLYLSRYIGIPTQIAARFSYDRYFYQTSKRNDQYRFGRKDDNYEFTIAPRVYVDRLMIELEYKHKTKSTNVATPSDVAELDAELEYTTYEISLNLRYQIF